MPNVEDNVVYKCACGREFKSRSSLNSHARFCDKYIKKPKKVSKYKVSDDLYRCECGREFNNSQSLNAHLSYCKLHHSANGSTRKKKPHEKDESGHGRMAGWDSFTEEERCEIALKHGKTYSENQKSGKTKNPWKDKCHTEEEKDKIRKSTIEYLKKNRNFNGPRYNVNACKYIDSINEQFGWQLQHALNGGEYEIDGYFVDGYDKALNIVFEYDEPKHYIDVYNNILRDKDVIRQQSIIEKLHCIFYRYNEKLDLLYRVEQPLESSIL